MKDRDEAKIKSGQTGVSALHVLGLVGLHFFFYAVG
jgi:hypothetical protein